MSGVFCHPGHGYSVELITFHIFRFITVVHFAVGGSVEIIHQFHVVRGQECLDIGRIDAEVPEFVVALQESGDAGGSGEFLRVFEDCFVDVGEYDDGTGTEAFEVVEHFRCDRGGQAVGDTFPDEHGFIISSLE